MDGTFGGGDLISASLAIMLGGTDAELHDKEVTLTTSDVTGSQTAIFEYDPQNEPVSGDPPGPWDGYSLFTIDLSAVKDDIEDLQQRVSDLEDELEQCHDCWEEVVAKLQEYDPEYDPDEGECPTEEIGKVVVEKEQEIEALEEQIEECDQCKADVIAKLQEYDPTFDPVTCADIPAEIDKVTGFPLPPNPDMDFTPVGGLTDDQIVDTTANITVEIFVGYEPAPREGYIQSVLSVNVKTENDELQVIHLTLTIRTQPDANNEFKKVTGIEIDPTNGNITVYYQRTQNGTIRDLDITRNTSLLLGFADTGHNVKMIHKY